MDESKDNEDGSVHEAWDEEEVKSILTQVIKVAGKDPFTKEFNKLDWEVLKPDGRDADECKNMFAKLTKKIRKYRTVKEIVTIAQESLTECLEQVNNNLNNAQRPLSAFIMYCQDNANKFKEKYPDLSRGDRLKKLKKKWLKSEKTQILYKNMYHESYEVYRSKRLLNRSNQPNKAVRTKRLVKKPVMPTPFKMYMAKKQASELKMNPELDQKQLKVILKSKYNKLAHHKKFHYMIKAKERMLKYKEEVEAYTQSHPNFSSNFVLPLSKDEKTTLQICLDKPQSFPSNAYLFYCSKERPKIKEEEDMSLSEVSKQLGANYGRLDNSGKDSNENDFKEALSSYIEKLNEYKEKVAPWSEEKAKETSEMIDKYQKILSRRQQKKKTPPPKRALKREISEEEEQKREISEDEESPSEDSDGPLNAKLRRIQRSSSESLDSDQDDKKSSTRLKKELDSSS